MKKVISLMLITLMLSVGIAIDSNAGQYHHDRQVASATKMISGQIAKIGKKGLTLKDSAGKYHMVSLSDSTMLQGLKSGDEVTVDYENGKVASIKKVEGYSHSAATH